MVVPIEHVKTRDVLSAESNINEPAAKKTLRIKYVELTPKEINRVKSLIEEIFGDRNEIVLRTFLENASVYGQELPRRVRSALYAFKLHEDSEAVCVRGFPLSQSQIGPTPRAHRLTGVVEFVSRPEVFHLLCASLLGEPFGWITIQNGYILNDVMPVDQDVHLIASSGSASPFDLHTEDAFHRCAGDYLGLMCFRNPDRVATVLSNILPGDLSRDALAALFEARYTIGANVAQQVPEVNDLSPVLFGNRDFPYLRVNLNNTRATPSDGDAIKYFDELKSVLRKNARLVVFEPGDCWYIDNLRVAHGRWPFKPRFDGTDRWLKRLYISSCFRASVAYRATPSSRILNPLGFAN